MSKFKAGDTVVRNKMIEYFTYGAEPLVVTGIKSNGDLFFKNDEVNNPSLNWIADYFELVHCVQPEVKPTDQMKVDRKLRLTEMQKEAIQAGINALYRHEESLKKQRYDPSLTYCIEICKYQQEVLRSMLREVNR